MDGKILHKIIAGHGSLADIDLLWDIQAGIEGKTICALEMLQHGRLPVPSDIFDNEFEDYIKNPKSAQQFSHYQEKYKNHKTAVQP